MARSVIGLDVGTAAVRAAEVVFGRGEPALVRFAQVALEPGLVVAGEVVDSAAVGAAIKRLWREGGFKSKRVVTGVAGQRVVARTTELPAMPHDELRSSLPFQVQELIPIPMEEAILDYQTLESITAEDGTERLRVLVVATHRDVVRSLLAAVEAAELQATRVDLIPFALIRALHREEFAELEEGADGATAEAIVDLGGGVTNVVVHEHGIPQFIRTLATGGVELTEAIATDLEVEFTEAEALKRRVDDESDAVQARQVLRAALAPLLEEVRTSLDFWQAQQPDAELRRILITGGATRVEDLAHRLELSIGSTVEQADPFARVDASALDLDPAAMEAAAAVATVAVGLALSGEPLPAGARRISLVPTEIAERRRERRQVMLLAGGVAAFAGVLMTLYAVRSGQVSDAESEANEAEARTAELEAQARELSDIEAMELEITTRRETVKRTLDGDIDWSRVIQEVAAVLPSNVWLTGFEGGRGTPTAPGNVSFNAMGFDHTDTARWIIRISDLDSLTGLWVPSSAKQAAAGRTLVTFSSNATLAPAAESTRVQRYLEQS